MHQLTSTIQSDTNLLKDPQFMAPANMRLGLLEANLTDKKKGLQNTIHDFESRIKAIELLKGSLDLKEQEDILFAIYTLQEGLDKIVEYLYNNQTGFLSCLHKSETANQQQINALVEQN